MSVNLSDKAMLVSLSVSQWTARKLDKKVTKEVAERHQVADGFGRYNKNLVNRDSIQQIQSVSSAIRQYHYENTMPWNDNGDRLLPASNYLQYTEQMRKYRSQFDEAVDSFCASYPVLVEDARVQLNGLFVEADYPPVESIRGRFSVSVDVNPIPIASDFRVTLNDDEVQTIKQSIELRSQEKLEIATRDLWQRLYEAINHMAKTLRDPEKNFKNSLVGNVKELSDLLPRLNVTNDPKLNELCKQASASLSVEPDALRDNASVRLQTANRAADILNAMNGYIN